MSMFGNLCSVWELIKEVEKHALAVGIILIFVSACIVSIFNRIRDYYADKAKELFFNWIISRAKIVFPNLENEISVSGGMFFIHESGVSAGASGPFIPKVYKLYIFVDSVKEVCPKKWFEKIFFNDDRFRKLVCGKLVNAGKLRIENNSYVFDVVSNYSLIIGEKHGGRGD